MMPSLPGEERKGSDGIEFMEKIAYLNMKTRMSHAEIMNLPYAIFLSYLKHYQMFDLMSTPEGREYLEKVERLKQTSPDFAKLRKVSGYKKAGEK
ncbi:hypothetical protein GT3570_11380 [Geobacillus thermoleovorans]|nr:hypothetical protein GT3570_11380 [Geobacillus thermoleovorans]